jgi:hypothetical protein
MENSSASTPAARTRFLGWVVLVAMAVMIVWACRTFIDFGDLVWQLNGKSVIDRGAIGLSEWQCFLARAGRVDAQKTFAKMHRELRQANHGGTEQVRLIFFKDSLIIVNPETRSASPNLEQVTVVRSEQDLPNDVLSQGIPVLIRSEKELSSGLEDAWIWVAKNGAELPLDAKVFLNEPDQALYYFCTFLWYPRRVEVSLEQVEVRDSATFDAIFEKDPSRSDPTKLSALEERLRASGYTHLITRRNQTLEMLALRLEESYSQ